MKLGSLVYYRGRQHEVVARCFRPPEKPVDCQHGQELYDLRDSQTDAIVLYVAAEALSERPAPLVAA